MERLFSRLRHDEQRVGRLQFLLCRRYKPGCGAGPGRPGDGRILGFNLDPEFSDVLDVLIMVDLLQTDRKILDRYFGSATATLFSAYHPNQPAAQYA